MSAPSLSLMPLTSVWADDSAAETWLPIALVLLCTSPTTTAPMREADPNYQLQQMDDKTHLLLLLTVNCNETFPARTSILTETLPPNIYVSVFCHCLYRAVPS